MQAINKNYCPRNSAWGSSGGNFEDPSIALGLPASLASSFFHVLRDAPRGFGTINLNCLIEISQKCRKWD